MDPNANLEIARFHARLIYDHVGTQEDQADAADTLAEAFDALDKWLTKGGFLPRAWDPEGKDPSAWATIREVNKDG